MLKLYPPRSVRKLIPTYNLPLFLQIPIGFITLPHELTHIGMAKLLAVAPVELYLFHFAWKKADHILWKQRLVLLAPFILFSLLLAAYLLTTQELNIIALYLAGQVLVCVNDLIEVTTGRNPVSKPNL